ncbi:MAG: patched family protein, partial [Rhodospirillaceae bacterium]
MLTKRRIEHGFEKLAGWIFDHAVVTLLGVLLLVGGLATQVPRLTLDTSTEGFLKEDDPSLLAYNTFRRQFGRDEMVFIAVAGNEVFDPVFLARLRALHRDLEASVPHVDDITSLVNARNTRGAEGALIVADLSDPWPEDDAALAAVRARARDNPVYRNLLLSEQDPGVTAIVIRTDAYSREGEDADVLAGFKADPQTATPRERPFLTDAENAALVRAVQAVVTRHQAEDFRLHAGGSPIVTDVLKQAMQENMRRFLLLASLAIAVVLALSSRRASGVFLPMLVVVLTLVSTFGFMAVAEMPVKIPTQILPSFLLAVGVGAAVHVLAIFYRQLQAEAEAAAEQPKRRAIVQAMGHSGLAIVMTSLTTAAGLASFAGAEIAPIADLGQAAAVGVLISLVFTILLLPALIALLPVRPQRRPGAQARMDRVLIAIATFATERRRVVFAISAVLFLFGIAGVVQIRFSHKPFEWLPASNPARVATDFIDSRLRGASVVEVVVDTGRENGLYEPRVLKALDGLEDSIGRITTDALFVGKTLSVADILKEINRALNENQREFYTIPDDRDLIAQEFLLFSNSGSDDLEDFVDPSFRQARFTVKMPWVDAVHYAGFMEELKTRFGSALGGETAITVTGMAALLSRTMDAALHSMAVSYLWAAGAITAMMIVLMGSVRIGLVSMIPNFSPIVLTLGVMGWFGLPLDLFTMLIGSIAIGLAVDDTVHFLHNYRRYHYDTGDGAQAVRLTFLSTGRAMLATTVVLSIGLTIHQFRMAFQRRGSGRHAWMILTMRWMPCVN